MAKLIQPVLFSQRFKVSPASLQKAGLLDPVLNSDTKLFIDPLLVRKSINPLVKSKGQVSIEQRFKDVLDLLEISQSETDAAWKGAYRALVLDERAETGLGYGGASTSGSSRPPSLRNAILRTAKEIITLGTKNPNVIPLMGIFEEGVGPDTLSDMATNYLLPVLCEITEDFCFKNSVPMAKFGTKYGDRQLPTNPFSGKPVILVPRDILRDLPIAADWSDVSRVAFQIQEIRDAVNRMFGDISKATITQKKHALRSVALSSRARLQKLLSAILDASESYDQNADLDGLYAFRKILTENQDSYVGLVTDPEEKTRETLAATVEAVIQQFKELIEANNLWELLWYGDQPRHERAAQLLFFAAANVLCAVNNVDISPETNSGGGPVDFKFSKGYRGRFLVELKLSKGQVVHGYQKQLERYKTAASTQSSALIVVDVGGMDKKMQVIKKLKRETEEKGGIASLIFYVDARKKRSASKA